LQQSVQAQHPPAKANRYQALLSAFRARALPKYYACVLP
jgi:hypothetical protein